jgi:hypothetical protein
METTQRNGDEVKTILSLCDFTGTWPKPYKDVGYNVIQVDIKHGDDVRLLRVDTLPPIYGVLAAPPCTHFAGSGARWWKEKGTAALLDGLQIVDACLRIITAVRPKWWALENPVGRLNHYLGKPTFYFDPCDYGDPYTKRTALWGDFTPPMGLFIERADWAVEATEGSKMHRIPPSPERQALRSVTPSGFAQAFFTANP